MDAYQVLLLFATQHRGTIHRTYRGFRNLHFEGDSIIFYGTTRVGGVVIGISMSDTDLGGNITMNDTQLDRGCHSILFMASSLPFNNYTIKLTLLELERSETGEENTGGLSIRSIEYWTPTEPRKESSIDLMPHVSATVELIALIGAIALQWFGPERAARSVERCADPTFYDASDMPPFFKTISRPAAPKAGIGSTILQSTGDSASKSHIQSTPSTSTII
ncbi:hypothetical protein FRC03_004603 [Tulasnella sp. 419]|nr:hypothetical protein FRC03_004603 [Tulasnella sp. 419]